MSAPPTRLPIRVIYGDTDQAGIVYHANYLRYFEASRGAFLRARGHSYADLEALGFALPVTEAHVRYVAPARYDELLVVSAMLDKIGRASLKFRYEIDCEGRRIAEGTTVHACVKRSGRPVRLPGELLRWIGDVAGDERVEGGIHGPESGA